MDQPGGDAIGEPILIRYDGLDAAHHEIELSGLADSLKGLSRIIGVAGNFAATQRYVQHKDALAVRVVVRPPEAHCFEIYAWVRWAASQPLIATTVGGLAVILITYIVKRAAGQREEMRQIKDSLDQAIKQLGTRDQSQVDRLLATIDKMADALRPAVKQAVSPIGSTASTLTIGTADRSSSVVISQVERDAILAEVETEIGDEQAYSVVISELDMRTGGCQVSLQDDPEARIEARITDPVVMTKNNPYALSMAAQSTLRVRAKSASKDGEIVKLYISDIARPLQPTA